MPSVNDLDLTHLDDDQSEEVPTRQSKDDSMWDGTLGEINTVETILASPKGTSIHKSPIP